MTNKLLLLLTSVAIVALSIAVMGCRNSTKTATPSSAPTPPGQGSTKAPPPNPVLPAKLTPSTDPATMTPVKTVQVQPPASFAAAQLSEGGPIAFMVQGNAGQFLRVKINVAQGAQLPADPYKGNLFSVQVFAPGTNAELETGSEDCAGLNLFALPQTGAYRVVFDRGGERLGIAFTVFDYDDPTEGPGIKPEQVSVDFGGFPKVSS